MRILVSNDITNEIRNVMLPPGKNPIRIGSAASCDVVLRSNMIPEQAAAISNQGDGKGWRFWPLYDGCVVDEQLLMVQRPVAVRHQLALQLDPYTLTIYLDVRDELAPEEQRQRSLDDRCGGLVNEVHRQLLRVIQSSSSSSDLDDESLSDDYLLRLEQSIEELATKFSDLPKDDFTQTDAGDRFAGQLLRSRLLRKLVDQSAIGDALTQQNVTPWALLRTLKPDLEREIEVVAATIQSRIGLEAGKDMSREVGKLEREFWPVWRECKETLRLDVRRYMGFAQLKKEIKDIWYGLGPLEDLLENPTITEIMVNDADNVFIEKDGVIENSGRRFVKDLNDIIQRIVTRVQRKIDTSTPMVDARLADGSRVNAIIKPLTVRGPCLTIRRFPQRVMKCDDLIQRGALTPSAKDFLRACVLLRSNILVAGGTGTGKTTLLNAISEFIPDKERILTIEDTAELRLAKSHVVGLETKQKNVEGQGGVDIRMLVKNSLRMRPDRIIVGECRGGEALDMLQAMNTGHDGSMTTIHANTPHDVVLRLEVMVQQNADSQLPVLSIHRQVASALDLIVQLQRETIADPLRPGEKLHRRIVSEIVEVVDLDIENGGLYLKPIFRRRPDGRLLPTGFLPTFVDRLLTEGGLDLSLFLDIEGTGRR